MYTVAGAPSNEPDIFDKNRVAKFGLDAYCLSELNCSNYSYLSICYNLMELFTAAVDSYLNPYSQCIKPFCYLGLVERYFRFDWIRAVYFASIGRIDY